jgi:two-component system nitrogen regulation sensor histidine kinase GlnL
LIDQLLHLSQPAKLNFEPLNIHQILDQVLLLEKGDAAGSGVEIRKNFDPSLPSIRGDRAQLMQVFLNLVKNAFQAMGGQGALTVTTRIETDFHIREHGRERGKFVRVDIEDNRRPAANLFTVFLNQNRRDRPWSLHLLSHHQGARRHNSRRQPGRRWGQLQSVAAGHRVK